MGLRAPFFFMVIAKLQKFKSNINSLDLFQIFQEVILEMKEQIIDLNTEGQLFEKGIDSDGEKLPLPYSPVTIIKKKLKGQPTDRITLKDEGDLYRGWFIKFVSKGSFIMSSTDSKVPKLLEEWGNFFGLTKESIEFLQPEFKERFVEKVKTKILR